jgi:O-antigen/teichoic acid export membrane protein
MNSSKNNSVYNLLLTIANLTFPILSFPDAARILVTIKIVKVQFITSFAQYFTLIAALEIPTYGIRKIAKRKGNGLELNRVFSERLIIYASTSAMLSIIYLTVISVFERFNNAQSSYYLQINGCIDNNC